jgi:hypothetical protein
MGKIGELEVSILEAWTRLGDIPDQSVSADSFQGLERAVMERSNRS